CSPSFQRQTTPPAWSCVPERGRNFTSTKPSATEASARTHQGKVPEPDCLSTLGALGAAGSGSTLQRGAPRPVTPWVQPGGSACAGAVSKLKLLAASMRSPSQSLDAGASCRGESASSPRRPSYPKLAPSRKSQESFDGGPQDPRRVRQPEEELVQHGGAARLQRDDARRDGAEDRADRRPADVQPGRLRCRHPRAREALRGRAARRRRRADREPGIQLLGAAAAEERDRLGVEAAEAALAGQADRDRLGVAGAARRRARSV